MPRLGLTLLAILHSSSIRTSALQHPTTGVWPDPLLYSTSLLAVYSVALLNLATAPSDPPWGDLLAGSIVDATLQQNDAETGPDSYSQNYPFLSSDSPAPPRPATGVWLDPLPHSFLFSYCFHSSNFLSTACSRRPARLPSRTSSPNYLSSPTLSPTSVACSPCA